MVQILLTVVAGAAAAVAIVHHVNLLTLPTDTFTPYQQLPLAFWSSYSQWTVTATVSLLAAVPAASLYRSERLHHLPRPQSLTTAAAAAAAAATG